MTIRDSILVRGPLPPLPGPRIVFAPGQSATFDGDRWHCSVNVLVRDDGLEERRTFDGAEVSEALDVAHESAERWAAAAIVLDGREWLRAPLPEGVVDRIEAELGRMAEAEGAVLVVRTWEEPTADDRDRYAAVIDRADERTWRGEPADPPRRRCSHSPDTAPVHPSPDP